MDKYKELFETICEQNDMQLIKLHQVNANLIEVNVAYKDYRPMDIEAISMIAKALSESINYDISLDVSSSGAERSIEVNDYSSVINQYVQVKFIKQIDGADYVQGILKSVDDKAVILDYRVLHATKSITIPLTNIKELSLAVKI